MFISLKYQISYTNFCKCYIGNSQQNYPLHDCCADILCGWLKWEFAFVKLRKVKLSLSLFFLRARLCSHTDIKCSCFILFNGATVVFWNSLDHMNCIGIYWRVCLCTCTHIYVSPSFEAEVHNIISPLVIIQSRV